MNLADVDGAANIDVPGLLAFHRQPGRLDGDLMGHRHSGSWSCMDTLKEKNLLEDLWRADEAPWRIWGPNPAPLAGPAHD